MMPHGVVWKKLFFDVKVEMMLIKVNVVAVCFLYRCFVGGYVLN